jgi:hypothetical protein
MIKQYTDLFFGAWRKAITLLSKPLGAVVLFGLLLIGGFAIAFWQRDVGYVSAETKYVKDIIDVKAKNKSLEKSVADIQFKLDNYDCISVTQKYILFYQNLEKYVTDKKHMELESLENQRKKTKELEKTLNTL